MWSTMPGITARPTRSCSFAFRPRSGKRCGPEPIHLVVSMPADFKPPHHTALSMSGSDVIIVQADLSRREHQQAVVSLLNAYAMDPMGDGRPLSDAARRDLIPGLRQHPTTVVFLGYLGSEPVG